MKQNMIKQLCMCTAVYELLTALLAVELVLPEEKIQKHVGSTLSIRSVQNYESFHVIAQAPFRQGRDVVVL